VTEFAPLTYDEDAQYSLSDDRFEASVIGAFQKTFNDSPYEENFDYEMTEDIFRGIQEKDTEGLLALEDGVPVGFAWGEVLEPGDSQEFPQEVPDEFFDGTSYYFAELGVLPDYRDQGIGKELKQKELEKVKDRQDLDKGLMRTSIEGNEKKRGLDEDLGFQRLEPDGELVTEEVDTYGVEGSDLRGYFWRPI
jgi:GNAT superfamily N-acetyltransferase